MKKKIVILPGDGIGKEVTLEGKKTIEKIAEVFGHEFEYDEALIGHEAIAVTGNPLPDETLVKLRDCDAILFGAVGHPKYDNDPTLKPSIALPWSGPRPASSCWWPPSFWRWLGATRGTRGLRPRIRGRHGSTPGSTSHCRERS